VFKNWTFGVIILLAGCGSKTITEPRSVKVFQDIPSVKSTPFNSHNCHWENIELSIFNQKDQKIKFDYLRCPQDDVQVPQFRVKNGNEIYVQAGDESQHIFTLWKTASHTEKEFIESLILEQSRDKCVAIQDENKTWKIGLNEYGRSSFGGGWVMYPPLSDNAPKYSDTNGVCGVYGFNPGNDWVFGVKEGIGIAYSELMALLTFYDLNSITYENRG